MKLYLYLQIALTILTLKAIYLFLKSEIKRKKKTHSLYMI